ncbi:MAG: hypothetical protein IPL33_05175 [Sphingobacteriales bacterium]|nr:hypothetical protein [Sphingobacteriales bacterium]
MTHRYNKPMIAFTTNLIEKYGSEQCFIKLVAGANDRLSNIFLDKMLPFELKGQVVTANLRKIFELYTQKNWVETFRTKVLLNDNPVSSYTYSHEVTVSKATFKLADLIPEHSKDAEAIEQAKSFLRTNYITYTNLFDTKSFPKDKIVAYLSSTGHQKHRTTVLFMGLQKKQ